MRFTERRVPAEKHHWRAGQPGAVPGWVLGTGRAGPLQLVPVYRALRKAFEDQKHEPGAADFYYGEMEMRRHADDIPRIPGRYDQGAGRFGTGDAVLVVAGISLAGGIVAGTWRTYEGVIALAVRPTSLP
ncbi:hypothetical protein ACFVOO_32435 [Streptomyces rochei]|uniref:hypothetical protein n=1 Tax=Streptomyces TaxID=1883 RepID=UPI0036521E1F